MSYSLDALQRKLYKMEKDSPSPSLMILDGIIPPNEGISLPREVKPSKNPQGEFFIFPEYCGNGENNDRYFSKRADDSSLTSADLEKRISKKDRFNSLTREWLKNANPYNTNNIELVLEVPQEDHKYDGSRVETLDRGKRRYVPIEQFIDNAWSDELSRLIESDNYHVSIQSYCAFFMQNMRGAYKRMVEEQGEKEKADIAIEQIRQTLDLIYKESLLRRTDEVEGESLKDSKNLKDLLFSPNNELIESRMGYNPRKSMQGRALEAGVDFPSLDAIAILNYGQRSLSEEDALHLYDLHLERSGELADIGEKFDFDYHSAENLARAMGKLTHPDIKILLNDRFFQGHVKKVVGYANNIFDSGMTGEFIEEANRIIAEAIKSAENYSNSEDNVERLKRAKEIIAGSFASVS